MIKVRTLNPLVISMVKKDIPIMYVGVGRPIRRTNPITRVTVTSATSKDIKHKTVGLEP